MFVTRGPMARSRVLARRLARDRRGNALIEFGFVLPILIALGGYGIEISNLALSNLRVSHAALQLADNASRVGLTDAGTGLQQMREVDVVDVIQGLRLETAALTLVNNGRVTLSSLEEKGGKQILRWQRCVGQATGAGYASSYGVAPTDDSGKTVTGMGEAGGVVTAPEGSGVMFVEINYDYQPLFGTLFVEPKKIRYIASMIVRDNRNFTSAITNPSPTATKMTCDKFTT